MCMWKKFQIHFLLIIQNKGIEESIYTSICKRKTIYYMYMLTQTIFRKYQKKYFTVVAYGENQESLVEEELFIIYYLRFYNGTAFLFLNNKDKQR